MPRHLTCLFALLTAATQAQTAPGPPPPSSQPAATIQSRTNLVIEDVVVTDRAGNPVRGLLKSDFILSEKGTPQQIRTFDEHAAKPAAAPPTPLDLPPGTFTNYAPVPISPALNVLLIDTLNTPLDSQAYLRQQLLKYIRSAAPGQQLAIFGLTTHLILLQGFTSDPAILRAAVDRKTLRSSVLLDNATTGAPGEQMSDMLTDLAGGAGSQGAMIAEAAANMRQFEADTAAFQLGVRSAYTLDALATLARYLAAFPGRKNVLWFSGGYPINIFPDATLKDAFRATADVSGDLTATANVLARAQVAVYPIDARGLFNDSTYDASNRGQGLSDPRQALASMQRFNQQTAAEHTTMLAMAEATGGRAFINTNDLVGAVSRAVSDGSNFYTLSYSPSDTRLDGTYRKVELKLQGSRAAQGLTLAYRRGYFALDPNASPRRPLPHPSASPASPAPSTPLTPAPTPPPTPALHNAMLRGAPGATDIIFKVAVLPTSAPTAPPDPAVAPSNQPDPKLAKAPFRTYAVDFAAFPSQLLTRGPAGNYTGSIRFITIAYNAEGAAVNLIDQTTAVDIPPGAFQVTRHSGLRYHQLISVPAKGDFFLRIGVADLAHDHIGSVEVPIVAIKNLPPSTASAPSPPPHP